MKIAIIGSGISGLTAAYLLNRKHDIEVFEKDSRLGGHTATIDIELEGKRYAIDTGFIVYNDWTYPNFIKLLDQLGVERQETAMGFSVSCQKTGLEYSGGSPNALFAQRKNLLSPSFWRMLRDIVRFNKEAERDLHEKTIDAEMTLGEYLSQNNYSDAFSQYYLIPMGAAIWSASLAAMKAFPVQFFVRFFYNHGLLNIFNRPQWRVIKGGSRSYIDPLVNTYRDKISLGVDIVSVKREQSGVRILLQDGSSKTFDHVVFACHSDQALKLLEDPSDEEQSILGNIQYQENQVVLHYDDTILPKRRSTWSSWNYRLDGTEESLPVLTYNMNILQGLEDQKVFCVTLNEDTHIDPQKILGRFQYAHPQFSKAATLAQARWSEINGVNNSWFCGAYWANGFHEDGVVSALRVAEQFGESL